MIIELVETTDGSKIAIYSLILSGLIALLFNVVFGTPSEIWKIRNWLKKRRCKTGCGLECPCPC